jgi:hypothetical protein
MTRFTVPKATLTFGLIAGMAQADLTPAMAKTFDICATAGPSFDARVEALGAQGWQVTDLAAHPDAGLQFASFELIVLRAYFLFGDDPWDMTDAREQLDSAARRQERDLTSGFPGLVFMADANGGLMRIDVDLEPTSATCLIAAPGLTAPDVARHLGLQMTEFPKPPVFVHAWQSDVDYGIRSVQVLTFSPLAFGDHDPLPLLSIISARVPPE